jgi:hypothetical protein
LAAFTRLIEYVPSGKTGSDRMIHSIEKGDNGTAQTDGQEHKGTA